ncbi:ribosome recycling factor [Borreliella burgdorferi]|uniref:ribosome recycling factor n=1 Tax=Borreliella burgdorferi TaxID=139 RepID=UPI001E4B0E49|nr:ribosome recycling factor [Borreliella burgdorferi]MCD2309058.1 ribosome recycling factor [Borreliella burgdorferi]MCD2318265.1 ribosome recycling factor [Borreliella burgdorferi]MCD2380965.1 ribosome recycling factor [Borreliella burgdorferi]MDO7272665.1 ribosome recycling factor [Borreliella burgdorferi]
MEDYKAFLGEKMNKVLLSLDNEYKTLRTGRISSNIFDRICIQYHDRRTPITQVSSIRIPEARLVVIQPWDKSILNKIEQAILNSDLSMNPSNDGSVIRIKVPNLTSERRQEIVKHAKKIAEEHKISTRNIRQDLNNKVKKQEKESEITEDSLKRILDDIQKSTDMYIKKIDSILESKIQEIMEA